MSKEGYSLNRWRGLEQPQQWECKLTKQRKPAQTQKENNRQRHTLSKHGFIIGNQWQLIVNKAFIAISATIFTSAISSITNKLKGTVTFLHNCAMFPCAFLTIYREKNKMLPSCVQPVSQRHAWTWTKTKEMRLEGLKKYGPFCLLVSDVPLLDKTEKNSSLNCCLVSASGGLYMVNRRIAVDIVFLWISGESGVTPNLSVHTSSTQQEGLLIRRVRRPQKRAVIWYLTWVENAHHIAVGARLNPSPFPGSLRLLRHQSTRFETLWNELSKTCDSALLISSCATCW